MTVLAGAIGGAAFSGALAIPFALAFALGPCACGALFPQRMVLGAIGGAPFPDNRSNNLNGAMMPHTTCACCASWIGRIISHNARCCVNKRIVQKGGTGANRKCST